MQPGFWHERWHSNRIGFHQDSVSPMLAAHWDACQVPVGARVFVPLCGKSLDMAWLAGRGHRVLGVELSSIAVEAFFEGIGETPAISETRYGRHYVAGPYEIVQGDAFALDAPLLAGCAGTFDRAALVALPPAMRAPYLTDLYAQLPARCHGLVVTLEYPQAQKAGPPFSVGEDEVRAGLASAWQVDLLERRDVLAEEPVIAGQGVTALATTAYRIRRR